MKKINLDIVRFLASLLIIAIHISPFDQISSEFDFFGSIIIFVGNDLVSCNIK